MQKLLLRLTVSPDDLIPIIMGFCAVNGDLRLFTQFMDKVCKGGRGGARRAACRYMEHLAVVKEPLLALEKLAEELGKNGDTLKEIVRGFRLGVEPAELAERIVENMVVKLRSRAETVDELAKGLLEVLALVSSVLAFSFMFGALLAGVPALYLTVIGLSLVVFFSSAALPTIVGLASPRLPLYTLVAIASSIALSIYTVINPNIYTALLAAILSIPLYLNMVRWWRQNRSIASAAIALAETMQLGLQPRVSDTEDPDVAYSVLTGLRARRFMSTLGDILIDILTLVPQEGSVTAARLIRYFAEFASRYLELVKSALVKSLTYEVVIVTSMPALTVLTGVVLHNMLAASTLTHNLFGLTIATLNELTNSIRLMLIPGIVFTLAASKVGRGTILAPMLHWIPALAAIILSL